MPSTPQILITNWSHKQSVAAWGMEPAEEGYAGWAWLASRLAQHGAGAGWHVVHINGETPIDWVFPAAAASDVVVLLGADRLVHRSTEAIRGAINASKRLVVFRAETCLPPEFAQMEWLKAKNMCDAWRGYSNHYESKRASDCFQAVLSSNIQVLGLRERIEQLIEQHEAEFGLALPHDVLVVEAGSVPSDEPFGNKLRLFDFNSYIERYQQHYAGKVRWMHVGLHSVYKDEKTVLYVEAPTISDESDSEQQQLPPSFPLIRVLPMPDGGPRRIESIEALLPRNGAG